MKSPVSHILIGVIALALSFIPSSRTLACAVCFGDPESSMTHGAQSGILVMLLITYSLLIGLATMIGIVIFCARRRLKRTTNSNTSHD